MTAFRQSVEAMIPALRRYARALARDADVADDLVQDTLVRALRSERLFLGGDVRSWLYTILTNLNKNRRRSLARRPQFVPLLDNNPDASGTEAEGRDIARALATLVEEQRAVLLLVMLEGLSYREVAEIQGVPIGTVMSRLARARAHVKASLDGERVALRRVKRWQVLCMWMRCVSNVTFIRAQRLRRYRTELRSRRCGCTTGFGAPRRMMENRGKTAARISGAMAPPRARSFWDDGC